jgi:hypothetical protein
LANWLKKTKEPTGLLSRKSPYKPHKDANPKWSDDAWFEKRYGDPNYYTRVKGLS